MKRYAVFTALVLALVCGQAFAAAPPQKVYRINYLGKLDPSASGQGFTGIRSMYINADSGEVYVLDAGAAAMRVIIFDSAGVPVYWFPVLGITSGTIPQYIAAAKDGTIYVATQQEVLVYSYRGRLMRRIDIAPLGKGAVIYSLTMDPGDTLYVGYSLGTDKVNRKSAIALYASDGSVKDIKDAGGVGESGNILNLKKSDGRYYFLDPSTIQVVTLDGSAKKLSSFGKYSSLLGGFSQPTALDVKKDVIYVVDWNRKMVILFDLAGNPLTEFGGPTVFRMPNGIIVDDSGKIYVSDSGDILMFEVKTEATQGGAAAPGKK